MTWHVLTRLEMTWNVLTCRDMTWDDMTWHLKTSTHLSNGSVLQVFSSNFFFTKKRAKVTQSTHSTRHTESVSLAFFSMLNKVRKKKKQNQNKVNHYKTMSCHLRVLRNCEIFFHKSTSQQGQRCVLVLVWITLDDCIIAWLRLFGQKYRYFFFFSR